MLPCQVARHVTQQLAHIQTHIHATRLPDIDAKSMLSFFSAQVISAFMYWLVGLFKAALINIFM